MHTIQTQFDHIDCLINLQKYRLKRNLLNCNAKKHQLDYYSDFYVNKTKKRLGLMVKKIHQLSDVFEKQIKYLQACEFRVLNNIILHYQQEITGASSFQVFQKQQQQLLDLIAKDSNQQSQIVQKIWKDVQYADLQAVQRINPSKTKCSYQEILQIIDYTQTKTSKQYDNFERSVYGLTNQLNSRLQGFNHYLTTWSDLSQKIIAQIPKQPSETKIIDQRQIMLNQTLNNNKKVQVPSKQTNKKRGILKNKQKKVNLVDWYINQNGEKTFLQFSYRQGQLLPSNHNEKAQMPNEPSLSSKLQIKHSSLQSNTIGLKDFPEYFMKKRITKKEQLKLTNQIKQQSQGNIEEKESKEKGKIEQKKIREKVTIQKFVLSQKIIENVKIPKTTIQIVIQSYFEQHWRKKIQQQTDPQSQIMQYRYIQQNKLNDDDLRTKNGRLLFSSQNMVIFCEKHSTLLNQGKVLCRIFNINTKMGLEQIQYKIKQHFESSIIKVTRDMVKCQQEDRDSVIIGMISQLSEEQSDFSVQKSKRIGSRILKDVKDYLGIQ